VSVAGAPPEAPAATFRPPAAVEACPLCGAMLHPEQEWCLSCGAAARTRLAAAPSWRGLVAVLAVVVVLCLGVLAAALVKLAGSSSAATSTTTTTTVTAPAATTPLPGTAK
jgi:RNA polymerase subunit RPABC4/transcription elongation factor Spt4